MYTALWFDGIDRQIASANYGAAASFTRPSIPPTSSSSVLLMSTTYDEAGRVYETTGPTGAVNKTGYDNASRTTEIIEDLGGLARTTNLSWTLDNLKATLTAVNAVTGNQTITWTYGTTLSSSAVARNDLPASVTYPDGGMVGFAYNRLGERRTLTDQRGTVHSYYRDRLGRKTNDCVTTLGSGTDGTVLQISWEYEIRGMVSLITCYDSATQNSGTVLNQCQLSYNTFAQLVQESQSHSGAVTGTTPGVYYGFDTGASGSNEIRLNNLTYPNFRSITYSFGTPGGMNDRLNRVDTIQDTTSGTTNLASYTYLGLDTVVRKTYPQPGVWLDLWGGTSGVFAGLDPFNRVIDQRWQNNAGGTPVDIDRYQYGYDFNSNRQYKANVVGTANVPAGLDEYYTYDTLNRLTDMQRGVLNGSNTGITGTIAREMAYGLDPTGNWNTYVTATAGTTDLNQGRVSNTANEIASVSESGGTPLWVTPAYDLSGNMTTMPQPASPTSSFTAIYDSWMRLTVILAGSSALGQYQYDGRDRRIVSVTTAVRHYYFSNAWREIEQRLGSALTMDQQNVWGPSYVDELICRDDSTPERLYATQDGSFNVTAVTNSSGTPQEYYYFDPYGARTILDASWNVVGASAYQWSIGHQGLPQQLESGLILNRHRTLHPNLGLFVQRDDLKYSRGLNLYTYCASNPCGSVDPAGRDTVAINVPAVSSDIQGGIGAPPPPQVAAFLATVDYTVTCPKAKIDAITPGDTKFSTSGQYYVTGKQQTEGAESVEEDDQYSAFSLSIVGSVFVQDQKKGSETD